MDSEAYIQPSNHISWQILDDKAIIKDEKKECYYEFENTGFDIINMILSNRTNIRIITNKMLESYDVKYSILKEDIENFVSNLIEDGLVCINEL